MTVAPELICDTEAYRNFWSIGFLRQSDGKLRVFEHSDRKPLTEHERDVIAAIMRQNTIVGYNFLSYDAAMIALALGGASNERLKQANDQIIVGGLKYWNVEENLGVRIPREWTIVDLIEPQPNAWASLKTLAGRLHAPKMQDLPYPVDATLTHAEMDEVLSYMGNDLQNTALLKDALAEPLALRARLGAEYGMNFMSKSDAQIGEAILKRRVEDIRGERVFKEDTPAGTAFKYTVPPYLTFQHPEMADVIERLRTAEFVVRADGKVDLPKWLDGKEVVIGETTYAMGIGGLHSTEKNRTLHSDDEFVLLDFDVTSYYPAIIINSGLYPKSLGRHFLTVFAKIRDERVAAKQKVKELDGLIKAIEAEIAAGEARIAALDDQVDDLRTMGPDTDEARRAIKVRYKALDAERDIEKAKVEGLKICLNGCFGKLGSRYSILYAPHLMIAVTLTGQLSLLNLVERAERIGIAVVSANTDGVVFRCPRDREDELLALTEQWEADTAFELESTKYQVLCSASVNRYIAIKDDGKPKRKGIGLVSPRADKELRTQLMTNPNMEILSNAAVAFIRDGTPIEQTIRAGRDIRDFVTVVNVKGGGTWRGEYLGKVVRYYWAKGGDEILYKEPHPTTGNFKKVSKTDGCRPLMDMDVAAFPDDVDYGRYLEEARELLMDIGFYERPRVVKPLRLYKWSALAWFAVAV